MTGISQTINNFHAGISQQPDQKKLPGQVKDIVNGIPDVTEGLYKRPGSKRIGTTKLANVQSNGSWFHYYRDEVEGIYIGQVAADGKIRMWCTKDIYNGSGTKVNDAGDEIFVHYDTVSGAYTQSNYNGSTAAHTAITGYLTPSSAANTEDIQALTISDTTFLNNRTKAVTHTGTTDSAPHAHYAYIDLLRSENGRQYGLNIFSNSTTTNIEVATKLKIVHDTLVETAGSGHCPGIGTEVFDISYTNTHHHVPLTGCTFATSDEGGVANSRITVTTPSAHNLVSQDKIRVNFTAGAVGGVTSDNNAQFEVTSATTFYYITGRDNGDHTNTACSIQSPHLEDKKKDLTFRIEALGQQGRSPGSDDGENANEYACTYSKKVTLLHGGEGWKQGDRVAVVLTQAQAWYTYVVEVQDTELIPVKGNMTGQDAGDGIIRPKPTPFDADTAVTTDTILGGIHHEISTRLGLGIINVGTGLYLYHNSTAFSVEVNEKDLMRVMQDEINDVSELPQQCKHGYIVKVVNSAASDNDDYYLKFVGNDGQDGPGSWEECTAPGIVKGINADTMPHVLQRQTISGTNPVIFLVKKYSWEDRLVGDDATNPLPTFISIRSGHPDYDANKGNQDKYINRVLFFRNRLALLSGTNVILSRPGDLALPSFFAKTALAVSAIDPIDITSNSIFPSTLYDGVETTAGLVVFSTNQQFLLASDDTVLNPDTAKLRTISSFNYNKNLPPISLGTTVGYVDNSGKFSRFNEMANIQREGEPVVVEMSKLISNLLPRDIDLLTNSRENQIVLFGKTTGDIVYGFRYFTAGEERKQLAWFTWKLNNPLIYHFIVDDDYYYIDGDHFLQKMSIMQGSADPSITQDSVDYLIHLDNWTTVTGGVCPLDPGTITTFTNQANWIPDVTTPNGKLVIVDIDPSSTRVGRYAEVTLLGNSPNDDFTVPGNWSSGTFYIGYLYEYKVHFPTIYPLKVQGNQSAADVNSSLVLHRVKFNFGKSGLYTTTLQRVAPKTDYSQTYEAAALNEYNVSDAPYVAEEEQTVPVYEKNTNVEILLKSSHPAPATLHSMSWEGDYTNKNYQRA